MSQLELQVLSYNMHKGFSPMNRDFVLSKIRAEVRNLGADLVFLQEVLGEHTTHAKNWEEWPEASQFEFLSDEIWSHYAYGRNSIYDAGHHGNAILSKFPFESYENINISASKWDPRGFLHGVIRIPETEIRIHTICIHMGLLESFRRKQVRDLCKRIQDSIPQDAPLIVAGDFNDWRESISHALHEVAHLDEVFLKIHGEHALTFPSVFPVFRMDRIYTRGFQIQDARCHHSPPWRTLSDHLPIHAKLRI